MAIPAVLALGARVGMPVARELIKKYGPGIVDAVAGTGIGAFIGDKLFFGQDVKETPEGIVIEPEEKEPETLEELKKRTILSFPGEAVPPFKLPGFNEGVTGIDELTKPRGFGEGYKEPTLEDLTSSGGFTLTDMPDMSIMTMAGGPPQQFDKEGNRIYRINRKTYTEDELNFKGEGRTYKDIESIKPEAKTYLSKEQFVTGFENFLKDNPDFMKRYNAKRNETGFMKDQAEKINKYLEKNLPADSIQRLIRQNYGKKELKEGRDKLPTELATVFDTKAGEIGFEIGRSLDRTEIQNIEDALIFFKSQKINPELQTKEGGVLEGQQKAIQFLDNTKGKLLDIVKSDEVQQALQKELGDNFVPFKFDKSHPDRTLVPSDEASQFAGMDTYELKILESQVNAVLQPDLEKALARHIKNKSVDGAKNIIEMMIEYSIGTRMNTPFKKEQLTLEDKKWVEKNLADLVTVPMIEEKGAASDIKDYDNMVFGTLAQPSPEKIINDGIKVRRDYLPAKKRYEDSGAKNPFHTKLRDGGIVSINKMIEPLRAQR
jgi:hypothetical protein